MRLAKRASAKGSISYHNKVESTKLYQQSKSSLTQLGYKMNFLVLHVPLFQCFLLSPCACKLSDLLLEKKLERVDQIQQKTRSYLPPCTWPQYAKMDHPSCPSIRGSDHDKTNVRTIRSITND